MSQGSFQTKCITHRVAYGKAGSSAKLGIMPWALRYMGTKGIVPQTYEQNESHLGALTLDQMLKA